MMALQLRLLLLLRLLLMFGVDYKLLLAHLLFLVRVDVSNLSSFRSWSVVPKGKSIRLEAS